jgi:CBS domain-containing protein
MCRPRRAIFSVRIERFITRTLIAWAAAPAAMGVGYDMIGGLLSGNLAVGAVVTLLVVKSVIWVVSLSSGTSGGVLAPLLMLGGCAGWLVGHLLPGDPSFWALLGMAAMMGGTMRAPLTAMIFAFELSGSAGTLLPLLAATGAAYATTVLLLKRSILTEKIARRGRHVSREYIVDPFEQLRAADVMVTAVDTLPAAMTVDDAVTFFTDGNRRHKSYPIVDATRHVAGMASRADVLRWRTEAPHGAATLFDVISDNEATVVHPDDVLGRVADIMVENDIGRLPVVDGQGQLVGLVARRDLLRIRAARRADETERRTFVGGGRRGAEDSPAPAATQRP